MRSLIERRWFHLFLIPLVLVIVSSGFVVKSVASHTQISPVDEYVYLDYVSKIPEGGFVPLGSETGNIARDYLSCQGVAGFGVFDPEACGTQDHDDDEKYPYVGVNSADIYTPLYFGVAWAVAQPAQAILGVDLLTGARLSGVLWMGAASLLLYFSLRKLRVPVLTSAVAPLLLIGSLSAWWSSTFLSTDATAIFAGALGFFGLVSYLQKGRGNWLLLLIAAFVTLLKFQNFMVVVMMSLVVLMAPRFEQSSRERFGLADIKVRSAWVSAALMGGVAVAVQVGWMLFRSFIAVGDSGEQGLGDPLTASALLSETVKFISGMAWGASTPSTLAGAGLVVGSLTTWLIIGGAVAASLRGNRIGFENTLGFTWIAVSMLAAPVLAIATNFMVGYYFSLPSRYGISLLPFGIAIAAIVFAEHRVWKVLFAAFGLFAVAAAFVPVLTQ